MAKQHIQNEPGARGINMMVTLHIIAMRNEPLWHHKMEIVLGPRHGNIEQPSLPFDIGWRAES